MTVDEFVAWKVLPEFRPVVAAVRKLMKESVPDAHEVISYGIPMYGLRRPLAWINPSKTGITLGFRQGASFADRYGLLQGTGKHAKHVRMRNVGEVNRSALRYYIKQALSSTKADVAGPLQIRLDPRLTQIDTVSAHRYPLCHQERSLSPAFSEAPIGADDAMPWDYVVDGRKDEPDETRRAWIDVAICANEPSRNGTHPANDARGA